MQATYLLWLGLALASLYLPLSGSDPSPLRSSVKTLPLGLFSLAALIGGAPPFLTLALALSALGDFALSRRGETAFLTGLVSFAAAHLSYIALFLGQSGAPIWQGFATQLPLALLLLAISLSTEFWLSAHTGKLRWPVRAYVAVIMLMGLSALSLPAGLVTLGAGAFLVSDILLAIQLFRMRDGNPLLAPTGWLLWALYIIGQALIFAAAAR